MSRQRSGWYLLADGVTPFYGPVPAGVAEVDGPDAPATEFDAQVAEAEALLREVMRDPTRAELVEAVKLVGLSAKGTKAELLARLEEHVASLDGSSQVESVALVDEGSSDGEQLVSGEPGADGLDEDSDALGHGD